MKSTENIIVIDSNFILLPFQFKIDYFNEIRSNIDGRLKFIIFQQILDELENKRRKENKTSKFIRFLESGLIYLENNKESYNIEFLKDIKSPHESTDEFLLKELINLKSKGNNVFLATNDSELRKKAIKQHISTIFLRQRKYLSIERA
ncbi:MAG: PIN domain-containing protein [Candidatus Hermodarchaeota archaeon]